MIDIKEKLTEEELVARLQQDQAIMQSLGKIYFAYYYISIAEDSFVELSCADDVHKDIGVVGQARERLSYMCDHMVREPYVEDMHDFVNLDTIAERLQGKRVLSFRYRGKNHGWCEASFIPCEMEGEEKLGHVLYVVREVTEEVKREERVKEKDSQQVRIINALSQDYSALFLVAADTHALSLYRTSNNGSVRKRMEEIASKKQYEDAMSYYIKAFVAPEDRERMRADTAFSALLERVPENGLYKVPYCRKAGQDTFYFEMEYIRTYDENERLVFVMGIRDVTDKMVSERLEAERVAALETAQKVTAEMATIHASLGSGNCSMDFDDHGELLACHWSKEVRTMLGYEGLADFPDRLESVLLLIHPDDKKKAMNSLWGSLRDYSGKTAFDVSFRVKTKTRGYRWFRSTGRTTRRDDGSPLRYYGVIMDVNEAKESEQTLREQYDIVETLNRDYQTIFLVNFHYNTVRALKLEGYIIPGMQKEDYNNTQYYALFQKYIFDRVHPDDVPMMLDAMREDNVRKQLTRKGEYVMNYRVMEFGIVHYYQFVFASVPGVEDRDERLILGFHNIDQIMEEEVRQKDALQAALDAARQANLAKTAFLNNMSHDIRTPMNAIIGFTELALKHQNDPEAVVDYLDKITTSSKHLLSLINDVLDMSRIESGKVVLEEGPANINDILRDITTMVQSDMDAHGLHFITELEGITDENVVVDKLRLNQILLNLLSNAMKFTRPGGEVTLKIKEYEEHPEWLGRYEFSVSDTGIGMSKEFLEKVFEPFERERTSTVTGIQGTGLGMAITKNLVEMMGGTINVRSWEGVGSTFTVILNLNISAEEATESETQQEEIDYSSVDFSGTHILLVEDNELNREIAEEILTDAGFAVTSAGDGSVAVDRMECAYPGLYDVILMDIQMPVMNGYEATKRIRQMSDEQLANIPILAMTANAFDEDKKAAFEAGMNGHIAKPIDVQVLLKELYNIVKK